MVSTLVTNKEVPLLTSIKLKGISPAPPTKRGHAMAVVRPKRTRSALTLLSALPLLTPSHWQHRQSWNQSNDCAPTVKGYPQSYGGFIQAKWDHLFKGGLHRTKFLHRGSCWTWTKYPPNRAGTAPKTADSSDYAGVNKHCKDERSPTSQKGKTDSPQTDGSPHQ